MAKTVLSFLEIPYIISVFRGFPQMSEPNQAGILFQKRKINDFP